MKYISSADAEAGAERQAAVVAAAIANAETIWVVFMNNSLRLIRRSEKFGYLQQTAPGFNPFYGQKKARRHRWFMR
jgi:hypothetical protein